MIDNEQWSISSIMTILFCLISLYVPALIAEAEDACGEKEYESYLERRIDTLHLRPNSSH